MSVRSVLVGCSVWLAGALPAAADPNGGTMAAVGDSATYEFTGIGQFCPLDREGDASDCTQGVEYTGIVTIVVLAPAPSGPGAFMSDTIAGDPFGWVESDFVINWDNRSFSPEITPGEPTNFSPRHEALVRNDNFGVDGLDNMESYSSATKSKEYVSLAVMRRRTTDTSWLDDVSFDLTVDLAPVVGGGNVFNNRNEISFNKITSIRGGGGRRGFIGQFELTSLIPRTRVEIDIRPDSDKNNVNPKSKGVITVAVLGSTEFDATQVDFHTVEFGPGNASPKGAGKVTDVNGDGFFDMLFHFKTGAAGIRCGSNAALLNGRTFGDEKFVGADSIRTVNCH